MLKAISDFNNDQAVHKAWKCIFGIKFIIRIAWRVDVPPYFSRDK